MTIYYFGPEDDNNDSVYADIPPGEDSGEACVPDSDESNDRYA